MNPSLSVSDLELSATVHLLQRWMEHGEQNWVDVPGRPGLGFYGTGYNNWGVQTNQKFLSAMAVLSELGPKFMDLEASCVDKARRRALAALRFSLASHLTGDGCCSSGEKWGNTWISALGVERMMHGVYLLEPYLTERDRDGLRRMLVSEAQWQDTHGQRGKQSGPVGDVWGHSGKNHPESNIWNGAVLWRAAVTYPDHPDAEAWKEKAHVFLINGVSIAEDADSGRIVSGKAVKDRHVGANFFPRYALDHHGYLNVGYMVICISNAAMLHFDLSARGQPVPESVHHHQGDLWEVTRRFLFGDGRLARLGGDTRVRYAYCQEYTLPALLYAADRFGEAHAGPLINAQLGWIRKEAELNEDGSFYGQRLASLAAESPYYYTRLESDRACTLGMLVAYAHALGKRQKDATAPPSRLDAKPVTENASTFEASVGGAWCEAEHGAVLHRSPTRLAGFSWRAFGLTQGMCQPPDCGHDAEWSRNLAGQIVFKGEEAGQVHRRLREQTIQPFEGGFITFGSVEEGCDTRMAEGWHRKEALALHQLAIVALPDGHTMIGLQHARTLKARSYLAEVKGMHLNVPNDLFNDYLRQIESAQGQLELPSPPPAEQHIDLDSRWACIDKRMGIVGIYGADALKIHRTAHRRGGKYRSLYVDEFCWACEVGTRGCHPDEVILDVGWVALASVDADVTAGVQARRIECAISGVRIAEVTGMDGERYEVLANFGDQAVDLKELEGLTGPIEPLTGKQASSLGKGQAMVARRIMGPGQ